MELGEGKASENKIQKGFLNKAFKAMATGMAILAFAGPIKKKVSTERCKDAINQKRDPYLGTRPYSWLGPIMRKAEKESQRIWQCPEMRFTFFEGVDEQGRPKFNI